MCMWFQSIKSLLASAFSDKMSVTLAVNAAPGGGEMSETLLGEARCMKGTVQSAGGDGKVVKGLKIVGMHAHARLHCHSHRHETHTDIRPHCTRLAYSQPWCSCSWLAASCRTLTTKASRDHTWLHISQNPWASTLLNSKVLTSLWKHMFAHESLACVPPSQDQPPRSPPAPPINQTCRDSRNHFSPPSTGNGSLLFTKKPLG